MRSHRKRMNGFTLVELLVVISIMAILLSILLPALGKAREQAKQALCMSNLHQWGLSITLYAADNAEKLLDSVDMGRIYNGQPTPGGGYRLPSLCAVEKNYPGSSRYHGMFSAEGMEMYLPGCDLQNNVLGKVWNCPSNKMSTQTMLEEQREAYSAFHVEYSYFARVDDWDPACVTRPAGLTGNRLTGSKLLMSDTLYRCQWFEGRWMYNHGLHGPSIHYDGWGDFIEAGVPSVEGINQLYGDGHVEWRTDFIPELMATADVSQPHVMGDTGSGSGGVGDSCFYAYDGT